MSDCDPHNKFITVHGVEFCMIDMQFGDPTSNCQLAVEFLKAKGVDEETAVCDLRRAILKYYADRGITEKDRAIPLLRHVVRYATPEDIKAATPDAD